jgi:hypothetical protein
MELQSIVKRVDGFADWNHADRIRFLGWWLHTHGGKEHFQPTDITACHATLHLEAPSVHPFLRSLVDQKQLLKSSAGYRLEMKARRKFDDKYGEREETVNIDKMLSELPAKLAGDEQRVYLDEALTCFRSKAWRAATIMTWNLAYDHLLRFTVAHKLSAFNAALAVHPDKRSKKRDVIASREDLNDLREGFVIDLCQHADVVTTTLIKLLKVSLNIRNDAAHPSGGVFNKMKVESYISELVEGIVLGLKV